MNTALNKQSNVEHQMNDFFTDKISPKDFAKRVRRLNHLVALFALRVNENEGLNKEWLEDGFYWINELAETLDPFLEIE